MNHSVLLTAPMVDLLSTHGLFFDLSPRIAPAAGRLKPGSRLAFDDGCELEPYIGIFAGHTLPLRMGAFSYSHSPLPTAMRIGRYCSIAPGLKLMGANHPVDRYSSSPFSYRSFQQHSHLVAYAKARGAGAPSTETFPGWLRDEPELGHDVWIGQDVTVARGLRIGTGAVIAAASVVVKDVPAYAIVGGNPARVIRHRFGAEVIDRLLRSAWWEFGFSDLPQTDPTDLPTFLDAVLALRQQSPHKVFAPKPWRALSLMEG